MRSMTGSGLGSAAFAGGRVGVEIRSLNHKFLEIRVRMPPELARMAVDVETKARALVGRGRHDVQVSFSGGAGGASLDVEAARRAYGELSALRDAVAPGTELPLTALAAFPGLFERREPEGTSAAIDEALALAANALFAAQLREGRVLATDMEARRGALLTHAAAITQSLPALGEKRRERLRALVAELGLAVDDDKLLREAASLSERSDVTEELVRLGAHLGLLGELFRDTGGAVEVGRRLEFLLQEIVREISTLAAKAQDAGVAHRVVEMKAEIEKLREQVQNIA